MSPHSRRWPGPAAGIHAVEHGVAAERLRSARHPTDLSSGLSPPAIPQRLYVQQLRAAAMRGVAAGALVALALVAGLMPALGDEHNHRVRPGRSNRSNARSVRPQSSRTAAPGGQAAVIGPQGGGDRPPRRPAAPPPPLAAHPPPALGCKSAGCRRALLAPSCFAAVGLSCAAARMCWWVLPALLAPPAKLRCPQPRSCAPRLA